MAFERDSLVERLDTLGALVNDTSAPAPVARRAAVFGAATDSRAPQVPPAEPGTAAGLFAEVSDALDADLETLDARDWSSVVVGGWSVQDTVVHLAAVHEVLATRLNGRDERPIVAGELDQATDRLIAEHRHVAPSETRRFWRASVDRLRHGLAVCDTEFNWLGLDVGADTAIVDRSFETWIHANDIRRVTNRSSLDPSGQHMFVMCNLAIDLLPLALIVTDRPHHALVTVNLSGPGGGTWTMPLGSGAASGVEFTLNAAARELCLLMGDRIDAADFAFTIRGDDAATDIMRDLVDVAPSFARP